MSMMEVCFSALWAYNDAQGCLGGLLHGGDHTDDQEQSQKRAFWCHDYFPTINLSLSSLVTVASLFLFSQAAISLMRVLP